ncbi:hypothetical protein O181_047389 [Austropuccinia psidii MF-1]|uniref:Uncharacterized protein n=1 Tax=Austropuccinia psidii MF-1 TaxID=1389203 RepID=A0A9Q3DQX5_9BASI|nr:hypothetical protein [Austropuccinia psidii MF-1]
MSSKLTEITESSSSEPPPSVLCGSGVRSKLVSPGSMAFSGHFYPSQTYDGYKAKPCHHTVLPASNIRGYLWSKKDGPLGKEFPVSEAPTPNGTSGYSNLTGSRKRDVARWTNVGGPIPFGGRPIYSSSEVPISRINNERLVKQIRQISNSSPDPDADGSDQFDGDKIEVTHSSSGHQSSTSPSHPPAKRFQSHIIPSTPRAFQPILSTIPTSVPPASPSSSTTSPALILAVRPYPIVTSQHLR